MYIIICIICGIIIFVGWLLLTQAAQLAPLLKLHVGAKGQPGVNALPPRDPLFVYQRCTQVCPCALCFVNSRGVRVL